MAKKDDKPDLGAQISEIRKKKMMAFAMQIGKDGLVFVTDLKTKSVDKLWRDGKSAGGSAKGAKGMVRLKGKELELLCDDVEGVPGNLVKIARKHFADNKVPMKIILSPLNPADVTADDEEEEAAEQETTSRTQDDAAESEAGAAPADEAEETAEEEVVAAVEEVTEEPVADEVEEAVAEGEDTDEALRGILQKEFDDLSADIESARQSSNAGAAKKVEALQQMFANQISGDVKKTASVMSLLKATVQDAIKAGVPEGAAGAADKPAVDPAIAAARQSKMEELEKGVDALLAEFA